MIPVLVSDENGVYFVGFDVSFLEHAANLFTAETRVDEHFAIFRDKESAIAGTAKQPTITATIKTGRA